MRRGLLPVCLTLCLTGALGVACTADDADVDVDVTRATVVATDPADTAITTASTAAPTTSTTIAPEVRALELCSLPRSFVLGQVADPALDEASGLVASRRHSEVIWTHNDGADDAGLFALGTDGTDLGFHPVLLDELVDIEDIAMVSGPDGDDILLADIGDNGAGRASVRVHRFAEPDPSTITPTTDVEVLEFVYPDRPHNAEVLLVDEVNRRIVIVTKEQRQVDGVPPELGPTAPSFVFEGPLDGHDGDPVVLTPAGHARHAAARNPHGSEHATSQLPVGDRRPADRRRRVRGRRADRAAHLRDDLGVAAHDRPERGRIAGE